MILGTVMQSIMLGIRSDLLPALSNYPNDRTRKLEFLAQAGIAMTAISSFYDYNFGCPRLAQDKTLLSHFYENVDLENNLFDYAEPRINRDMHFIRYFRIEEMGCKASLDHADLYSRFFCSFLFFLEIFDFEDSDDLENNLGLLRQKFPKLKQPMEILSNGTIRRHFDSLGCTTHDKNFHVVISIRSEKNKVCFHRALPSRIFELYSKMYEEFMRHVRRSEIFSRRTDSIRNGIFHKFIYEKLSPAPSTYETLTIYQDCYCVKLRHLTVDNHSFQFDRNISIDLLMITSRFLMNFEMREMTLNDLGENGALFSRPIHFSDISTKDRKERCHYHSNPEVSPELMTVDRIKQILDAGFCESHNLSSDSKLESFLTKQKKVSERRKRRSEIFNSELSVIELESEEISEEEEENVWDHLIQENSMIEDEWRSPGLEDNSVMIDIFGIVHFYCSGQFYRLKSECLRFLFVDGHSLEGSETEILPLYFSEVELILTFHREKIGIYGKSEIVVFMEFMQKMKNFSELDIDTLVQSVCQIFQPVLKTTHESGLYRYMKPKFCSFFPGFSKFKTDSKIIGQLTMVDGKVQSKGPVFEKIEIEKMEEDEEEIYSLDQAKIIPHTRILEIICGHNSFGGHDPYRKNQQCPKHNPFLAGVLEAFKFLG